MKRRAQTCRAVLGVLATAAITFCLTGCGSYRVVRKTATGGEVALEKEGLLSPSREKALEYIAGQCGAGYEIVEEGEAVVGEDVTARSVRSRDIFGRPTDHLAASSTQKREWRIKYACKSTESVTRDTLKPSAHESIREIRVRF